MTAPGGGAEPGGEVEPGGGVEAGGVEAGVVAPLRVLVVDDEPDLRVLVQMQLESAGFDVIGEASDGAQAVERCAALAPDAVVLDLLMPRVNWFEAIPRLRAEHPDVAIVAYTAVAGDFVRNEMARLRIPLVLKTGAIDALVRALNEVREPRPARWGPATGP